MTQRPEVIQKRLSGLGEIGLVVGALRAIASSQAAASHAAVAAISSFAQTIEAALATITATAGPRPVPKGPGLLLVIGAAQGFSGAYPARIAEAARSAMDPDAGLLVIGHRTRAMLEDAGVPALWSADLPGHPAAIADLASEVTEALIGFSDRFTGPVRAIVGAREGGDGADCVTLFPQPMPEGAKAVVLPLTTMPAEELLTGLLQEALFAAVARALMLGMQAEALARVEAMARAQGNLADREAEVQRDYQQARQDQMTTEVIELTATLGPAAEAG